MYLARFCIQSNGQYVHKEYSEFGSLWEKSENKNRLNRRVNAVLKCDV